MSIGMVTFDLSMKSPETGEYLTARAYTVEGVNNVDGTPRELSIGQLVMAICLKRASELEAGIIDLMESINRTSLLLETLTEVEQAVVDYFSNSPSNHAYTLANHTIETGPYAGTDYKTFLKGQGVVDEAATWIRDDRVITENADVLYDDFISNLEAKMDENNSFSQQKMIELQSQTSKRDQTYDMISNILKSINQVLTGNVNNM